MLICRDCRFDSSQWTDATALSTLRIARVWFGWLAEGAPDDIAADLRDPADRINRISREPADEAAAVDAVHDAWHTIDAAGRIRHRATPPQDGHVAQVNSSRGGVPKRPIETSVEIGWRGLVGDAQHDVEDHGRPWQALCIWSADTIDALAGEGHPIAPGSAGENITVRGVDWAAVTPGQRMTIGTALVETTPYAVPCSKNAAWFVSGEFRRMSHDLHPGWSRIYARVLEPGGVRAGDKVSVLP